MGDDPQHHVLRDGGPTNPAAVVVPATLRATALPATAPTVSSAALIESLFDDEAPSQLMFAHDCVYPTCRAPDCRLCKTAARKQCDYEMTVTPTIEPTGGVLAACGAAIVVDVVTTDPDSRVIDPAPGTCARFFLVDNDAYDAAVDLKAWHGPPDDVVPAFVTMQSAARGTATVYHTLSRNWRQDAPAESSSGAGPRAPASAARAASVSAAVEFRGEGLPGSDWNVRPLRPASLVRLIVALVDDETGELDARTRPAVSDPFVVHTQPRRLVKVEIARSVDPVTVLPGIGVVASTRLSRLAHLVTLPLPVDVQFVQSVGDMKRLVQHCAHDPTLDDAVRNALSLARSVWGRAKQAVLASVEPDSRLRAFFTNEPAHIGVVFLCRDGVVNLNNAPGVLLLDADNTTYRCVASEHLDDPHYSHVDLDSLTKRARQAWFQPGHPGWDVLTSGDRTFDSMAQLSAFVAQQAAAPAG